MVTFLFPIALALMMLPAPVLGVALLGKRMTVLTPLDRRGGRRLIESLRRPVWPGLVALVAVAAATALALGSVDESDAGLAWVESAALLVSHMSGGALVVGLIVAAIASAVASVRGFGPGALAGVWAGLAVVVGGLLPLVVVYATRPGLFAHSAAYTEDELAGEALFALPGLLWVLPWSVIGAFLGEHVARPVAVPLTRRSISVGLRPRPTPEAWLAAASVAVVTGLGAFGASRWSLAPGAYGQGDIVLVLPTVLLFAVGVVLAGRDGSLRAGLGGVALACAGALVGMWAAVVPEMLGWADVAGDLVGPHGVTGWKGVGGLLVPWSWILTLTPWAMAGAGGAAIGAVRQRWPSDLDVGRVRAS